MTANVLSRRSLTIYLSDLIGGGVPQVYLGLAPYFREAGYDVTLLLDRQRGEMVGAVPEGVSVVELGVGRQLLAAPKLARYLRRTRPDILLTAIEQMNVSAVVARRLAGVKTRHVATQHNPLSVQAKRPGLQFRSLPFLYRTVLPGADAIVAVSKGVADDMTRRAGLRRERIEVIYNGVVRPGFDERAASALPVPPAQGPRIVTVGRLAAQKDHATLVRAFALLRDEPRPELLIVGDGPLRGELMDLARELGVADRVQMPGFLANPLPAIAGADLFVLSSRYEGHPLVPIEALACGTPVVSTDCPYGPDEILESGRYGRLVPVGDPPALAAAMAETLRDPPDRAALLARGQSFSVARCAEGYVRLFERLLRQA